MIGTISETRQEVLKVEWEIKDFLSLKRPVGKYLKSPTFQFSDCTLQLGVDLFGDINFNEGLVGLFLFFDKSSSSSPSITVLFTLAVKKTDGTFSTRDPLSFKFHDTSCYGYIGMLARSDLQLKRDEFLYRDALTFSCTLRKVPPVEAIDELSVNFKKLLVSSSHSDVTVKLQSREYRAHRAILAAHSDVFSSALEHDTLERESGVIRIDDCDSDSFEEFLQYIYTGHADINENNVFHLFKTADKYLVRELKMICVAYLTENMTVENVCDAVDLADDYRIVDLELRCKEFFNDNVVSIIATPKWISLLEEHSVAANELLKYFTSEAKN